MPTEPKPHVPESWEHFDLWLRVRRALLACPDHFSTPTAIEGLSATDVFTLNPVLAATMEVAIVKTLNDLRPVWDPDNAYQTYSFVRQPQTFPDVLLRQRRNGSNILMGIELKGWYLLAKEKAPTFRFTATPAACSEQDLLVVVPWVLSNVLAGSPVLMRPFVEGARYCAEQRNHYWLHERSSTNPGEIRSPQGVGPYPTKNDTIADAPTNDGGNNFGRLARYGGPIKNYIEDMSQERVRGIAVRDWQRFFMEHNAAEAGG